MKHVAEAVAARQQLLELPAADTLPTENRIAIEDADLHPLDAGGAQCGNNVLMRLTAREWVGGRIKHAYLVPIASSVFHKSNIETYTLMLD